MVSRALHYARVYREFVATSLAEATSYRAHFVLLIVMELLFFASTLLSVDFLYLHVERVGVWDRAQFLFFVSYLIAVEELHMTFVSEGFWVLAEDIRMGKLDFHLMKPLSLFFTVFFRHVRAASILLIPVSWALLVHFGVEAGLPWWAWPLLPPLLLLSLAVEVALEVLVSAAMFLTVSGTGINFLRLQLQQVSRWPDFIYAAWPRRLFTFALPVLLIGNAPVRFLFDPRDTSLLLLQVPILALLCVVNQRVWRRALDGYSSASS